MTWLMRCRVAGEMRPESLRARETVDTETPASWATSLIVAYAIMAFRRSGRPPGRTADLGGCLIAAMGRRTVLTAFSYISAVTIPQLSQHGPSRLGFE